MATSESEGEDETEATLSYDDGTEAEAWEEEDVKSSLSVPVPADAATPKDARSEGGTTKESSDGFSVDGTDICKSTPGLCDKSEVVAKMTCDCVEVCDCDPAFGSELDLDKCVADQGECNREDGDAKPSPPAVCHCQDPREADPPPDPLAEVIQRLEGNLQSHQKEFCRSVFRKTSVTKALTEGELFDLLVHDEKGKPVLYLHGNQLIPKITSERLSDGDMITISNVLMEVRSVGTISLPYNEVGDRGLSILGSILVDCENVEHLNVMNNEIGPEGLLTFVKQIMNRPPLLSLRLSGNKFGDEGFEALSCLVLSGHVPVDLDVSETDMGVSGFQAFCAALHALDHDEDYPRHYVTRERPLPIDLETLKQSKIALNDSLRRANIMSPQKTDHRQGTPENDHQQWNELKEYPAPEKVPPVPDYMTPEVLEKFSTTFLESLYNITAEKNLDLRLPKSAEILKLIDSYPTDIVNDIMERAGQWDMEEFMAALQQERKPMRPVKVTNYREVPILDPNLYEVHQKTTDVEQQFLHDVDKPEIVKLGGRMRDTFQFQGKLVDPLQSILAGAEERGVVSLKSVVSRQAIEPGTDEYSADNAAKQFLKAAMEEAAMKQGASELDPQTDVAQLVLMTIAEVLHRGKMARAAGGRNAELTLEDCKAINEEAMARVMQIFEPKIPTGCEVSKQSMKLFAANVVGVGAETLLQLFQNPVIMEALHEVGTYTCHLQAIKAKEHNLQNLPAVPPNKITYLVSKFVEGLVQEAGRLVGSGDPFSYRKAPVIKYIRNKSVTTAHSHEEIDAENPIASFVKDIFDMGEKTAQATIAEAEEARRAEKDYNQASEIVVRDLFQHVQQFMDERESNEDRAQKNREAEVVNRYTDLTYRYVSRPTRLVLNRPLFHPADVEAMAMALGDYMKDNCSVKELYLRKWGLGEDGMIAFMHRIMENQTLELLDLSNNGLGSHGAQHLANYMKLNISLKHVLLSHNHIRDAGISHIAQALSVSQVESLNIAYNELTEVGLDPLLTQIPSSRLTTLFLWGNSFAKTTFQLYVSLLDNGLILNTDTLIEMVDEVGCIVKNCQVRDTNYWYEVPPVSKGSYELCVPPFLRQSSKKQKNAETPEAPK